MEPHWKANATSSSKTFYESMKAYRQDPREVAAKSIEAQFEQLCTGKTGCSDLNNALQLLHVKRAEFLAVLEHPHLPLHNSSSENDIREYARLRKISGGTRSDDGRRCRDTFMSLKKTCRKLGGSFQNYTRDRIRRIGKIPQLSKLMRDFTPDPAPG